MVLKVGGLFSGVGGIELGFKKAGFDISWGNEIDTKACVTYKLNHKHKLYEGNIKLLNTKKLESVDVITAGFPCQAFSIAGHRKGFNDDRGNLFFEIIRIVKELEKKPRVLFLENVKNFSGHDNGKTFSKVANIIQEDLGYSLFWKVLNTCDYTKLPQNRERTFMIAFQNEVNWRFDPKDTMSARFDKNFPPRKINSPSSIKKYLETNDIDEVFYYRQDKYMFEDLRKKMKSKETLYQWRRKYVRENKYNVCPTLTANMGTGGHNVPLVLTDSGIRKLTPRECFNFQGYPKSFKLPLNLSHGHLYKQAGNSVSIPLVTKLAKIIKQTLIGNN